jgi:hypothetical protein
MSRQTMANHDNQQRDGMTSVTIDSGALSPTYRFADVPKERWKQLVREKRNFLATNIKYDCRCLVEFCEEAEIVWSDLGYESAADMIRNGYELEPVEIELAVAWLRHNEPQAEVGLDAIKQKVSEARANPAKNANGGRPPKEIKGSNLEPLPKGSNNRRDLARIARDCPEMLDKIESGELSVNAAAVKAGIRKRPSKAEVCVSAFRKAENRLEPLRLIIAELEPFEAAIVRDLAKARLS